MDTQFEARPPALRRNSLFADDFGLPSHRDTAGDVAAIDATSASAKLAEECAASWAAGHATGTTEANAASAATTNALLEAIAGAMREASKAAADVTEQAVEAVARLLMDSLATLFPALCARHGEAELCALIRTILPAMAQEPALTVRVNPMHTPALMRELDRLDPDLVERVRLVPVEAIAAGDIRVTWRDGAAVRDTAELWQQVHEVLGSAGLLSHDPTAGPTSASATIKETEHVD